MLLALALKPRVLLLDEPAAGLSPAERVDIQALLRSLPPELTLVMIEHDIDVLRGVVDSAAVLHLGALVTQGSMRQVQDDERVREAVPGPSWPGRGRAVIEVRDLHTYRGINYVLQGVNLRIGDGACTVLLGRNGMGKTTLVHTIMGLIRPRSGRITLDDEELVGQQPFQIAQRGLEVFVGKIIGIDLGTTNSVVAIMEGREPKVHRQRGGHSDHSLAWSAFDENGERAGRSGRQAPGDHQPRAHHLFSAKRFIGRRFEEVTEEAKRVPVQGRPRP